MVKGLKPCKVYKFSVCTSENYLRPLGERQSQDQTVYSPKISNDKGRTNGHALNFFCIIDLRLLP